MASYQLLAKLMLIVAVAASASYGSWRVTKDHYEVILEEMQASNARAVRTELERQQKLADDQAKRTRQAEEQHALDQFTINRLGNQLAGVRVHFPNIGYGPVSGAGQASTDSNGTGPVGYFTSEWTRLLLNYKQALDSLSSGATNSTSTPSK